MYTYYVQEHIRNENQFICYGNYLPIGGVDVEEPWMEGASPFVGELTHPGASAHTLEARINGGKNLISKVSAKMSNQM